MKTVLQAFGAVTLGTAVGTAIGCSIGPSADDHPTVWSPPMYEQPEAQSTLQLEDYPWFESQEALEHRHTLRAEFGPQADNAEDPSKGWMIR